MSVKRSVCGAVAAMLLAAGCVYDWSFPGGEPFVPDGGAGDSGGTEGSTGDAALSDQVAPPDAPPPAGSCKDNSQCTPGLYCHFADHLCGLGALGTCEKPESPTCSINRQVCTCAGDSFGDSCLATAQLRDPGASTACKADTGDAFLCGYLYCKTNAEFCLITKTTPSPSYSCMSMDCGGGTGMCSCTEPAKVVSTSPASCSCSQSGTGRVDVTCTK